MQHLFPNLSAIAQTPRQLPKSWTPMIREEHILSKIGFGVQLISGLLLVLGIGGAVVSIGTWLLMGTSFLWTVILVLLTAIPVGFLVFGTVMRLVVKRQALAAGRQDLEQTPLAMAAVVQANEVLFDRQEAVTAPAVLVWASSGPLQHDMDGIRTVAERLTDLRDRRTGNPEWDRLGDALRDEESDFVSQPLPESVVGAPGLMWTVTYVSPDVVGGALPRHGVLPILFNGSGFREIIPAAAW